MLLFRCPLGQTKNNEEDENTEKHGADNDDDWIFPCQEVTPELWFTLVNPLDLVFDPVHVVGYPGVDPELAGGGAPPPPGHHPNQGPGDAVSTGDQGTSTVTLA